MSRRIPLIALFAASWLAWGRAQTPAALLGVDLIKPGMVGVGRTVFAGDRIDDFKVDILGVARNVIAPKRDLIIAKLSGGPLAATGVIAGMSGSPVYVRGKLLGAVAYAWPYGKEPIAGITPFSQMCDFVDA